MNLQQSMRSFKEDTRTAKANKNILYSIGIKGIDAITQFLLVPITLGFLNPYEYGIWLTLSSLLVWINSFDIGLGNGLRNELTIAIAQNDYVKSRSLVSTAFGMIAILMLIIFVIGSIILLNCNWYAILNVSFDAVPNLNKVVYVSFALFCVNFMVKFIGNVYLAMQMPSVNNLLVSAGHMLSLVLIWIMTLVTKGSLFKVAVVFSMSPIIIYALAIPITFLFVYKELKPSIRLFNMRYLKSLLNVGVLFFVLQISGVVLFALSNIILSNLFGPESVTSYNIAQRYFSVINMIMAIILSPMWSAVTDANTRGEIVWIRNTLGKTDRLIGILTVLIVLMIVVSPLIYDIWIGPSVRIPFVLSSLMGLYTFIIICSTAYSYFLNGLGKLRVQTITTLTVAIFYVPIISLLGKLFGIYGVIIGMCIINVFGAILNRIQVRLLVSEHAKGIWNK